MIIQGNNLIISANGTPLAASKSCNIEVKADTIEVSDVNDGAWEHSRTGRKSWKVTTNHILKAETMAAKVLEAAGGYGNEAYFHMEDDQIRRMGAGGGYIFIAKWTYNETSELWGYDSVDAIYNPTSPYPEDIFISKCTQGLADVGEAFAIINEGSLTMTANMAQALADAVNLDVEDIPTGTNLDTFIAIVGVRSSATSTTSVINTNESDPAIARITLYGPSTTAPTPEPLTEAITKVGTTLTLTMSIRGIQSDTLSGTAICTQCKISAARGNLCTGAFTFEGNGPLQ